MARCIMIQGTASHVGKSVLTAALCRIFAQDGYHVAPFKGWNMALNSYVTADGGEIGRAQGEQAEAAGIEADVRMNPILVKPKAPGQAQVIVRGRPLGDVDYNLRNSREYISYFMGVIGEALAELRREYEIVIIEGAGSPAEINLADQDVANMRVARLAGAPVLLVSDIDQGGALAAVVGTMLLLSPKDRELVAGFIFNKFRGDAAILQPGLDVVRERTGRPVFGVIPYLAQTAVAEEDGVALERRRVKEKATLDKLRIVAVRLPHISNFTDLDALAAEPDVALEFVEDGRELDGADALIIPGTKNSIRDLEYLHRQGLAGEIVRLARGGLAVVGICGGYQMLGNVLRDPEGSESGGRPVALPGLGLLPVETRFYPEKKVTRVTAKSLLPFAPGEEVAGYEIHMGRTMRRPDCLAAFAPSGGKPGEADGAALECGRIWGTYLHGVFDRPGFRRAWLNDLRRRKGWETFSAAHGSTGGARRFDALADHVRASLDLQAVYALLGLSGPKRGTGNWVHC